MVYTVPEYSIFFMVHTVSCIVCSPALATHAYSIWMTRQSVISYEVSRRVSARGRESDRYVHPRARVVIYMRTRDVYIVYIRSTSHCFFSFLVVSFISFFGKGPNKATFLYSAWDILLFIGRSSRAASSALSSDAAYQKWNASWCDRRRHAARVSNTLKFLGYSQTCHFSEVYAALR
jgi:hypothetical protein